MQIRVISPSPAVSHMLEAVMLAAGFSVGAQRPEITLQDDATLPRQLRVETAQNVVRHIACPVHPATLVQTLKSMRSPSPHALAQGWSMDAQARQLSHAAQPPVMLTEKEVSLLGALAASAPQAMPREALLAKVWGVGEGVDTHTLETHIYRLRAKLATLTPSPGELVTVAGAYLWQPAA